LQFEEEIEKTVKWYLENKDRVKNVTSGEYQKHYKEMYE
jgi:dTDP-glucose 4,6-dehydratase